MRPGEALTARDRGCLDAAWVERGHAPVGSSFVLRERWREALVDVLGRVHHDRQIGRHGR